MYTLNTEHAERSKMMVDGMEIDVGPGIKVTVPDRHDTTEDSGKHVATIEYLSFERRGNGGEWLVLFTPEFHNGFNASTFHDLDAAQFLVLAAYHEHKAKQRKS